MSEPFYSEDGITLYCGDSAKVLAEFPSECVDLTVTSPPYDNLRTYKGFVFDFETIARELYRVTKPGGVCVWVVNDATIDGSETLTSAKQKIFFREECGWNIHDTMIYRKDGCPFPEQVRYYQNFEYMLVLSKGSPATVNLLTDRLNNYGGTNTSQTARTKDGVLRKKGKYHTGKYGVRFNVWDINNGMGKSTNDDIAYEHPAIYPEQLAKDHIVSWSNEGDTILDCFAGSGTTLKAAKILKRKSIGVEISEEYCDLITRRLNKPTPLFDSLTPSLKDGCK